MNRMPLASRLEGKTVGKWKVLKKRIKTQEDDSGRFSSCYEVKNIETGKIAFLKGFNYFYAHKEKGGGRQSADILKELLDDYTYERNLLLFCQDRKMKRIVTAIDHGEYNDPDPIEIFSVPYLVFEIAVGSLKNVKVLKNPDLAWKLRAFHGCLVGLSQLHKEKIAHQDIKPSNILIFGETVSKLSDLGNATQFGNESPSWSSPNRGGDVRFAPIELWYGHFSPDWNTRRLGADLFMVGGIITYLLTELNFLYLIIGFLPEDYKPKVFGGTFAQAKPHLMDAYYKTLMKIEETLPDILKKDLVEVIAQLCHPVPEERGNPRNIFSSVTQYSLQRYISIIDWLAQKVEIEKFK